jgi:hypothetical protein
VVGVPGETPESTADAVAAGAKTGNTVMGLGEGLGKAVAYSAAPGAYTDYENAHSADGGDAENPWPELDSEPDATGGN